MKIEPGMLCTIAYEPGSEELCGLMVEAKTYLGNSVGGCKCGTARRWAVCPYPPGMHPCECVLIPIPPDSLEEQTEKEKECIV